MTAQIIKHPKAWHDSCLATSAGLALCCAFSPISFSILAVIALYLLQVTLRHGPLNRQAFQGWLFGIGYFGMGISWVFVSIHRFGNTNVYLAAVITLLFVMALALFPMLLCFFYGLCTRTIKRNNPFHCLIMPVLWVAMEWLRSHLLTGFPWLLVGYSQSNALLGSFAPLVGVYGTSMVVALVSSCLYQLSYRGKIGSTKYLSLIILTFLFMTALGVRHLHWTHARRWSIATLIQGNVSEKEKWNPSKLSKILQTYQSRTLTHMNSSLIIWPEDAIPVPAQDISGYLRKLDHFSKVHHTALLLGIPLATGQNLSNSAIALGMGSGHYSKQHLVPLGEYTPNIPGLLPLLQTFQIPMSDLKPGRRHQKPMIIQGHTTGIAICYEIAFPELMLQKLRRNDLTISLSDDSWFGDSFAPMQQLQMAQFHARSAQQYLLYSSNTGMTAVIDPSGALIATAPLYKTLAISHRFAHMVGHTPLTHWGYTPFWILWLFAAGLVLLTLWFQRGRCA